MPKIIKLNRREFFKITAAVGGGLILGSVATGCSDGGKNDIPFQEMDAGVFIRIDTEGQVTVYVHRTEMGQGVRTSLPMLVAEEMELDWANVKCEGVVAHDKYGPMGTGGSMTIRTCTDKLLNAGAAARTMLVAAAAQIWEVEPSSCTCEKGEVLHSASDRRLTYGELVPTAAELDVPTNFERKDPADYTLVGT